ncbi:MAG: hypothetical protein JNM56_02735 [Planctomycetia bacterium]|nr:hypothetical protein [Planctomycetia bacterium]
MANSLKLTELECSTPIGVIESGTLRSTPTTSGPLADVHFQGAVHVLVLLQSHVQGTQQPLGRVEV